ncbi:MAG: hypothetical protein NTZ39_00585 [Methanoregula sp.]|nr:hypothetical protein [Methanoregula sp.]
MESDGSSEETSREKTRRKETGSKEGSTQEEIRVGYLLSFLLFHVHIVFYRKIQSPEKRFLPFSL